MAYDKIIVVHHRLDHCINYAMNPGKTEKCRFVSGLNCDPHTAYEEMKDTKQRWDRRGGVQGYHIIHSFSPGETTPEEAQAMGEEFARRLLGDRFEAVVCTHLDHDHLHCHIVFNSVSLTDGRKYRDNFKAYFGDIREISNAVSREHGLSVIEAPQNKGRHYAEWKADKEQKPTKRDLIRRDIDAAIAAAFTYRSFWEALEKMGYTVKRGENVKHTAVRPPGGERYFRLDGLGEDYTEDAIKSRLRRQEQPRPQKLAIVPPVYGPRIRYTVKRRYSRHGKLKGFRALYVHYLYLLGKQGTAKKPVPFSVRQEVTKLERYQRQARFLRENGIATTDQLSAVAQSLQAEIDGLIGQRKSLYREKRMGHDVERQIQEINEALRPLRRSLRVCGQIQEDIPKISRQYREYHRAEKQPQKTKERSAAKWKQAEK